MRYLNSFKNFEPRFLALNVAIFIYALFGLPTPNNPGMVEIVIGALLIFAAIPQGMIRALHINKVEIPHGLQQLLLYYALTIPLVIGALGHGQTEPIIRDVLPFLFMLMPLFLGHLIKDEHHFKALLCSIIFLAVSFSFRASAEVGIDIAGFVLGAKSDTAELTYLANAPTILFSAVLITGLALAKFQNRAGVSLFLKLILSFALVAIIVLPLIFTLQRASLGYLALSTIIFLGFGLWRATIPTLIILCLIAPTLIFSYPYLIGITDLFVHKTSLVGLNMRLEELSAVWQQISNNPVNLIFGNGWGASFESPAVGNVRVFFTHSLLSSLLLKTGLIGLLLGASFIAILLKRLLTLWPQHIALVSALAGPILIDTLLYASFKSLDFGLLLLLCATSVKVAKSEQIM